MNAVTSIPKGFKMNAKGDLVALSNIKQIDLIRDEMVDKMLEKAQLMQLQLHQFKQNIISELTAFLDTSASEYGIKRGGTKGNITLVSFDGTKKVQLSVSENITFDERLQSAKELIHECITDWSQGANDNIRTIVNQAFAVDKEGNISTARVLGLRRLAIEDTRWVKAMEAIADSVTVTDTKDYIRFYKRIDSSKNWQSISLDIAAL